MNRAARALARENVATFSEDIAALGDPHRASLPHAARRARKCCPSPRFRADAPRAVSVLDAPARRSSAVQRVAGDLDAVEVRAWAVHLARSWHTRSDQLPDAHRVAVGKPRAALQEREADAEIIAALEVIKPAQSRPHELRRASSALWRNCWCPTAALIDVKPFLDGIECLHEHDVSRAWTPPMPAMLPQPASSRNVDPAVAGTGVDQSAA